jgi:ParB-like chromosome segregation protein Spo0J/arsenate reductase-like glutaredoxin family protein
MLNIDDLVVDREFEELLPVLTPEEFDRLEKSVVQNGMLDPIKVWEDPDTGKYTIIDGHNRYKILKKHNISLNYWENYKIMYADELPTRDDVKQWMLEQQLGRRNLSDAEKYEIVQKFKSVFEQKAKKNQSLGGKGSTNLPKVDTRKEMAKITGVSEGTYRKMDVVMKSDNEDLKQKLREKKVSVDAAYKEVKSADQKSITVKQQIDRLDKRINDIDKTIESLQAEKEEIIQRRTSIFYALDIKCPVKYRWDKKGYSNTFPCFWKCQMYIENEENENIFGEYSVYYDEFPSDYDMKKVPEKYKDDFRMIWKKAHDEIKSLQDEVDKESIENAKKQDEILKNAMKLIPTDEDKVILKQFYRVLANTYHPDNKKTGNAEMMKHLNDLKAVWGI